MKTKFCLSTLRLAVFLVLSGTSAVLITGCAGDKYSRSTGEYIDDKTITTRVDKALHDSTEYKLSSVQVVVFKGTVQLSGFVDGQAQKDGAAQIAKNVEGVRAVQNDITVGNAGAGASESDSDKSLSRLVNRALSNNQEYKFDQVNITCQQGTAQLSGFVNTSDQKSQAGDIAKNVPGVKDVVNNITVKDKLGQ